MPRHNAKELPPSFPDDEDEDDEFDADSPLFFAPPSVDQTTNLVALTNAARELIDYIKETDIAEVQLQSGPTKIAIRRALGTTQAQGAPQPAYAEAVLPASVAPTQPTPPASSAAVEPIPSTDTHAITSPMVGTFYHAPTPKDKPYITEGQHIEKGQIVGLIEAMKMMNEIDADVSGTVIKIVAANAQSVEYGQPLVLIELDAQN
jgi:acetyl-CoA carboxylase biotin carboxyl carrier protein